MYRVIRMYGAFEPWWFIDDWEDDVIEEFHFDHFEDALVSFSEKWQRMKVDFPMYHSRRDLLATFWDQSQKRFCPECDEDLQQYHSLLLLSGDKVVGESLYQEAYHCHNKHPDPMSECALKLS